MIGRRGVGSYPTEICYDPKRPVWLPYWVNSLTEAACVRASGGTLTDPVVGGAAPPTYPAPPKSGGPVEFSSTPTGSTSVYAGTDRSGNPVYVTPPDPGQSVADWKVEIQDWFTQQAANIEESCSTFLDRITPGTGCSLTGTDWLIIAGAGLAGLLLLGRSSR